MTQFDLRKTVGRARWVLLGVLVALIAGATAYLVLSSDDAKSEAAATAQKDAHPEALRGIHYDPPRVANEIVGVDHNAQPFTLSRQPHPLQMVFFGYVSCTDVCPTNLKKFEKVEKRLGERADQVQFVFVSIDTEKETPKVMSEYLENYDGEIIGVTAGRARDLDSVYDSWNIVRDKVELDTPINGRKYKYDHTGQIFLVQGGEKIPVTYPYGTDWETMAEDVEALLDDPSFSQKLPKIGSVEEVTLEPGTYTRAKQDNPTLPSYLRVRVGDAIRWKNDDYMYHFIGDIVLAPGDEATQKFDEPGEYYFGCTAVPSEVIRIKVLPTSESS
ncbi:MAG: SCO family protein [Myxococcota bacterium]